jgi:hypothetical protein
VDSVKDQARRDNSVLSSAVETFNKILKHYIATALVDAEASTLDWEAYLALLLFAYNTAVSSSTKVTPFEATFGYDLRVPLWEGVQYPGDEVVERKDFAEYLAQVRHTQLATREIAHHNNQHTRTEYPDNYNTANKVVYPRYVAGDKVWVKVMDKNQRSPNPKLAPPWERGTIVQRGVTGTSYKVERHDRKRKKVKTVNVQQIKPFEEGKGEEEETAIVQPPTPVPHSEQQTPSKEYDSEEGEDYELPDVDLGQEDEEDKGAERGTSVPVPDTPLPNEEKLLPEGYPPLPETPTPMPETPPQSEGMMTRAQARGGGEGETRTRSEDIQTRGTPSKTAATGSQEHRAGGTGTARAATGSREHGAGSRTRARG